MSDSFDNILGQPQVRDYLRQTIRNDRVSHAYLFCGPSGSNKTQSAFALSQALLCPKPPKSEKGSVCGACQNCSRIKKRTHPDVHFFTPGGANGYLIEQIREINSDVSYAPIQSDKKIYILDRVDLMGTHAANAFLKTLEEPPDNVVFILLGRTRDSVLSTIVSRCQVVPFRQIPPKEAAGIVSQNTGASIEESSCVIEANNGSITKAIAFLRSSGHERLDFRSWLLKSLTGIAEMDDWEVLLLAKELTKRSQAPLDEVKVKQDEDLKENLDFLTKSAVKQIEIRIKRNISAKTIEYLHQTFSIARSFLRDTMMACAGTFDLIINIDFKDEISRIANHSDVAKISYSLSKIDKANTSLDYNVSPEICLDVLLFEVREAFK